MIGSGDDVDRTALNPNRVDQPFDEIGGGLTKAQIVERLKAIPRLDYYCYDDGDGYMDCGMSTELDGEYHSRDDILAIIKEAENG